MAKSSRRAPMMALVPSSPLRRVDPRVKLLLSLCVSLAVMLPLERLLVAMAFYALLLLRDPENPVTAALAATLGHMGKFLVKWALGVVTGAPIGFVALGLAKALVGYIVFGALGGLLGALTLRALRRAGFFAYLAEKR